MKISYLFLLTLLFSCAKSSDVALQRDPEDAALRPTSAQELYGVWKELTCDRNFMGWQKLAFDFRAHDRMIMFLEYYDGQDCKRPIAHVRLVGEYQLQPRVVPQVGRYVDFWLEKTHVVALTESGRQMLEGLPYCGLTHYPVGVEVPLPPHKLEGTCLIPNPPERDYNIVYLTAENHLWFGNEDLFKGGEIHPQNRPRILADSEYFLREE